MTAHAKDFTAALEAAAGHAREWLSSVPHRSLPPRSTADELGAAFGSQIPAHPGDPAAVIDTLAAAAEPGLMAIASGRFFGWVMGGTLPAALGADWLVSTWDQNAGMRGATPGVVAAEEAAARWLLDVLRLPATSGVGFVSGGTMANFSCLAAARDRVLQQAGWDAAHQGLVGGPAITVLAGTERHSSVDVALRYLGLGSATLTACEDQGRVEAGPMVEAIHAAQGPTIICLQAGNLHSGSFDPFGPIIAAAHERGAWVHIDGAFGLWAGASAQHLDLVSGYAGADSWATDAHKTLNVPYDCGVAIVADSAAMTAALGVRASYLISDAAGDPLDRVPELSRRARGVPVWAALASLGRSGVAELVDGLCRNASAIAGGLAGIEGVRILNDVVYTQLCFTVGGDERTKRVCQAILADGTTWMSGSRWAGRDVIRVSVSNWTTDDEDIARAVDAVHRAVKSTGAGAGPTPPMG